MNSKGNNQKFGHFSMILIMSLSTLLPTSSAQDRLLNLPEEFIRLGTGQVYAIDFSPDGKILAASHKDNGAVLLWDVDTLRAAGELKRGSSQINDIAFSPDGTLVALASNDNTIRLWDMAELNQVAVIRTSTNYGAKGVAFSPDGETIAYFEGGSDKLIRLWDVQTQRQIGALRGHTQAVLAIAFSPDSGLLASGGSRNDEAVRLWDVENQVQIGEFIGHSDITYDLSFSPDGKILASAGGAWDKAVYLWDVQTYEQIGILGGHAAHVRSCAFSPDGKILASAGQFDDKVYIWDVASQEKIGVLTFDLISSVDLAFSPDGKWLACGGSNGVKLWELNLPGPIARTTAFGPRPLDDTLHTDTWVNLEWKPGDFAVSNDIYLGDNFEDVNNGAEDTFQGNQTETTFIAGLPGFAIPDGLVPGTTYYWRIDEVNDTDQNSPWKGPVWSFSIPLNTAHDPSPADGADFVYQDATLNWKAGLGAKKHTVYFGDNFDTVNNAVEGILQNETTYTPSALELAKNYYWRVDEFDGVEIHKGDVWSFSTEGAVGRPNPFNGAVNVEQSPVLSWWPGINADSHQVYFGTEKEAVRNADTSSPEYKGSRDLGSESYEPGVLDGNITYYWRIDEVNNSNPDSPSVGLVWSFTVADFILVDDFESYNDLSSVFPESNRIFNTWIDGFDNPFVNGAVVGHADPPFTEQNIVHSGEQSMPLAYDNSVGYSEATKTLTYPRDWTENGVDTLSIWFRGYAANAAEPMYVALNDNAAITHDNPDAAKIITWTKWSINLSRFAELGVNLTEVEKLTIGFGTSGVIDHSAGSGQMFFDDIRLYRSTNDSGE